MFISRFPSELQHKILMYLDGISLGNAECVCKIWNNILTTGPSFNLVWRRECLCNIEESVLVELTGIEDILGSELRYSDSSGDVKVHAWKTVYKKWHTCKKVGHWPEMKYDVIDASKTNISDVRHFQFSGDIIFTAHVDKKIRLWDSWTGTCLQTLSGHREAVTCMALYHKPVSTLALENNQRLPELIASGSDDTDVRIWNVETGSCQAVLVNHDYPVTCVAISKELLISASFLGVILLWDLFKNYLCKRINRMDFGPVFRLSVWKRIAMSVSSTQIKFWSLDTGDCIECVEYEDSVTSSSVGCILRNSQAVNVIDDGELRFWDLNRFGSVQNQPHLKYSLLNFRTTKGSRISCITTFANLLALGTEAGMVFIFHYHKDWSEQLTKIHHQVNTGCLGLWWITLSHDGEGPLLVTGHNSGHIKIFRWFSPSIS